MHAPTLKNGENEAIQGGRGYRTTFIRHLLQILTHAAPTSSPEQVSPIAEKLCTFLAQIGQKQVDGSPAHILVFKSRR